MYLIYDEKETKTSNSFAIGEIVIVVTLLLQLVKPHPILFHKLTH
jgi:hypothetical protein